MKNKIAVIGNGLSGKGGTESVLTYLGNCQTIIKQFDLELFIFSPVKHQAFLKNCGYNKVYSTEIKSKYLRLLKMIAYLIIFNGDALLVTDQKMLPVTYYLKKLFHKKYKIIFWNHYALDKDVLAKNKNSVEIDFNKIKLADNYFAISSGIKQELIENGIPADKIDVIYNPIQPKQKVISPDQQVCRFIYIARIQMSGQKNLGGLLRSLAKLDGSWVLDIYGSGDDLQLAEEFVDNQPNLSKRITFKGWVSDPWQQIKTANALLLNSDYEGLPMVLAEALSYGIPCVSSDCPTGPNDLISSGENGFLYPVNDYKKLNEELTLIINHEISFDRVAISQSVDFMFNKNYDNRFINDLKTIIGNRR
ncbi:glycosyltransferase [Fructilactobacillus sanfranciscensis]|uniref:glycosyltransferase n=1 Tax=Fructilactobacillus sanfranciscensis TaxID=1625 RepID=UPI0013D8B516|nr:glycosyltransferase [Fructilactobacillus sanfranciscensis]NDR77683.1 glycosyltransferase [Fructilactobacillus sanfranciscensis]